MGVLSALPLVGAANLCCCLWVVTGGIVAAYLLQQNQSTPITPGDGALVGLLAGLVGAVVASVLAIPISLMLAPVQRAISERILEMPGEMPPWIRDVIQTSSRQGISFALQAAFWFMSLLLYLVLGGIFSTVGGVLGALIFKRSAPPAVPSTIDQPPTFGV